MAFAGLAALGVLYLFIVLLPLILPSSPSTQTVSNLYSRLCERVSNNVTQVTDHLPTKPAVLLLIGDGYNVAQKERCTMPSGIPYESNLYYGTEPAELAVARLHSIGYGRDEISVMMDDKTREKALAAMTNAKGSEGVAAGATIGGVLGAIVAGMTATGAIAAIVGTGGAVAPLVAGPLAAALAGLGAGAAGGGIIGGLIGIGIAEHDAKAYEKGLREGGILVAVQPKSHAHREHVRRALDREVPVSSGEIDPSVDYAGEVGDERTRR